ncbi:hypothetical protein Fmac_004649 [Flemingia macrophylla]|uniref:J domain-containing protein n=1 Tax=Flemingia macrophylla TaxID=520843 RepID=A0ABD1N5P4_9FABA
MRCYGLTIPGSERGLCGGRPVLGRPSGSGVVRPISRVAFPRAKLREGSNSMVVDLSFYDLLGIPESGTLTEIKSAYKQLARKYHPDVSPPDRLEEYTKRFIQVQEAYETLSDPSRRAMYDRDMAKGISFAFTARRRYDYHHQVVEQRTEWKSRWQSQLSELKRRSNGKDAGGNMSWAARMRQQRDESC